MKTILLVNIGYTVHNPFLQGLTASVYNVISPSLFLVFGPLLQIQHIFPHRHILLFQSDGYQLPDYSITALMNPVRLLTVLSLLSWAIGSHLSL